MNFCTLLILGLSIIPSSASAATADRVELSHTFVVELPSELHAQMGFLPSLGGFWFEGALLRNKISIWIQRVNPPTLANRFSVKRFWNEGIAQATSMGEASHDKGCHSLGKYVFQCERLAHAKKERYASETLIWNAKSDLVVVRVMSSKSYEEAEVVAKMIQFKPIARLPASVKRTSSIRKPVKGAK